MPAIIRVVDGRTVIKVGENTVAARAAASLAEQFANAAGLSADAAAIAAAAVGVFTTVGDGESATTNGQSFYVTSGGEVTLYINNAGTGDEVASLVTAAALASSNPGEGAELVGYDDDTVGTRLNILSATMRPAMRGIFSGAENQLAALKAFVAESAADGKTIEWGPIDLSLDAASLTGDIRGLGIPTGSRWVMHPETRFRAIPNSSDSYVILNIRDVQDIVIEGGGARLIGERAAHTGVTGEHGMGLNISGANDIIVRDLYAQDCWGDGFYIGATAAQGYSQNVLLENLNANNNRRQGMSIVSARRLTCNDSVFTNTNGTLPNAGIDIEPNIATDYLEDIRINNPTTSGNTGHGIYCYLAPLRASSNPVSIVIANHRSEDDGQSGIHTGFACSRPGTTDDFVTGSIEYLNGSITRPGISGIQVHEWDSRGPRVLLDSPQIFDPNESDAGTAYARAGINIYGGSGGVFDKLGNVVVTNPSISETRDISQIDRYTYIRNEKAADDVDKIIVNDPLRFSGLPAPASWVSGPVKWSDKFEQSRFVFTNTVATMALGKSNFAGIYANDGATGTVKFSLSAILPVGFPDSTFEAQDHPIRIIPAVTNVILPGGATGKYLEIAANSRVVLRRKSATEWVIRSSSGTFTFEP